MAHIIAKSPPSYNYQSGILSVLVKLIRWFTVQRARSLSMKCFRYSSLAEAESAFNHAKTATLPSQLHLVLNTGDGGSAGCGESLGKIQIGARKIKP